MDNDKNLLARYELQTLRPCVVEELGKLLILRDKKNLSAGEEMDVAETMGNVLNYLFRFVDTLSSDEVEKVFKEMQSLFGKEECLDV